MNVPSTTHARMEERVPTFLEAISAHVERNLLEGTAKQVVKKNLVLFCDNDCSIVLPGFFFFRTLVKSKTFNYN